MADTRILDDVYVDQTQQLDQALESSQNIKKKEQALISHILQMILAQSQSTEEVGAEADNKPITLDSISSVAAPSSQAVTFNWPKDKTEPNPPFDDTIPPKNPGESDAQYYIRVLKKLEQMIAWQKNNPMNINGESVLLSFMIKFGTQFPGGLSHVNQNLMEALMKNLIASVWVDSNGNEAYTQQAINAIKAMFAGAPAALQNILNDFGSNLPGKPDGFNIDTYRKGYPYDAKQQEKNWQIFLLRAGGAMSSVCVDELGGIIKSIYSDELEEIYKLFLACRNPMLYYLLLLSVIGQKEADTQGDISGCGNMLKLLAKGESASSDAYNAFSILVNQANQKKSDAVYLQDFYKAIQSLTPEDIKKLPDDIQKVINEIKSVDPTGKKNFSSDFNFGEQTFIIERMLKLADSGDFKSLPKIQAAKFDFNGIKDKGNDFLMMTDASQKFADALLYLQEMARDLEPLLPGIKDATKKFFGEGGSGDFFTLTKLTPDILQRASEGDHDAQQQITLAIYSITPVNDQKDTGPITTINSEMGEFGTFFNDQNSQEQATAQYISSNDQKMLSFIKEMYDQPVTFIKAIMQNLSRT